MARYQVTGTLRYREHEPGTEFVANLPAAVEARAIARGHIRLLDSTPESLKPGTWGSPAGWPTQPKED